MAHYCHIHPLDLKVEVFKISLRVGVQLFRISQGAEEHSHCMVYVFLHISLCKWQYKM
jgi:hypothetical protein